MFLVLCNEKALVIKITICSFLKYLAKTGITIPSSQVAQARYMSGSMLTYVIRAICIFIKICMGKEITVDGTRFQVF